MANLATHVMSYAQSADAVSWAFRASSHELRAVGGYDEFARSGVTLVGVALSRLEKSQKVSGFRHDPWNCLHVLWHSSQRLIATPTMLSRKARSRFARDLWSANWKNRLGHAIWHPNTVWSCYIHSVITRAERWLINSTGCDCKHQGCQAYHWDQS